MIPLSTMKILANLSIATPPTLFIILLGMIRALPTSSVGFSQLDGVLCLIIILFVSMSVSFVSMSVSFV
jgi:hypothetical protein